MPSRKPKTLIILGALHAGGAETWAVNHAALQKQGTVEILAFSNKNQILSPVCPVHILPRKGFSHYWNFLKLLKNRDIDNIHCNTNHSAVFYSLLALLMGVRSIVHWHNDTRNIEGSSSFLKKVYYVISRNLILLISHKVLCVSEYAKISFNDKNIFKKTRLKKIDLVYCGTPPFSLDTNLSIDKRKKRVCHFGRFVDQKNHKRIIDIFYSLLKIDSGFTLDLYGEGELKKEILEYANKKLDTESVKVSFFSPVSNVMHLMYSQYDLLLMPSLNEGLPIVLMEAFSTGLPCLVSDQISKEVKLFPNVSVMSLDCSNDLWAKKVVELYGLNINQIETIKLFSNSPFNLENSSRQIAQENY